MLASELVFKNRKTTFALSGLVFGITIATKVNGIFILPILFIYYLYFLATRKQRFSLAWIPSVFAFAISGFLVFLFFQPFLWRDVPGGLYKIYQHLSKFSPGKTIDFEAIMEFLRVTPAAYFFILPWALVFPKNNAKLFLVSTWFMVPLARTLMPGAVNYDGIRHFIEFAPPMAILAGIGLSNLLSKAKRIFKPLILLMVIVFPLWNVIETHPFETTFYNTIVGGLRGAMLKGVGVDPGDYWGNSMRTGIEWLNESKFEKAWLITPDWDNIVSPVSRFRLRKGLRHVAMEELFYMRPEEIVDRKQEILVFINRSERFKSAFTRECGLKGTLVKEFDSQGFPVLRIYRMDLNTRKEIKNAIEKGKELKRAVEDFFKKLDRLPEKDPMEAFMEPGNAQKAILAINAFEEVKNRIPLSFVEKLVEAAMMRGWKSKLEEKSK